ncbi:hypothetical protein GCM10009430_41570 [Aquimarina litoralis]|uniref:DUF4440 domain-containing protein n=1 Tax=Aquimarina litoralis TaxID=584605 RepID=A0ABP3UCR9_9FLAO
MMTKRILIWLVIPITFLQCTCLDKTSKFSLEEDQKSVQEILKILDDHSISTEDKMMVWVDDLIHMAPNHPLISDKPTLVAHIEKEREYGFADMKHEITEMHSYAEVVVMHGRVKGTFYPANKEKPNAFSTKNMFVFRRMKDNSLKIWKVIFNMTS